MRLPLVRLTVRRMIAGAALFAPVLLLLRVDLLLLRVVLQFFLFVGWSLCGAVSQGANGPKAIVGGALGGVASSWLIVITAYAHAWMNPDPATVDYLGPFLSLGFSSIGGFFYGGFIGGCVWVSAAIVRFLEEM